MSDKMNENLAIFIDSYDGNSDVWDNFFKVFDEYWSDCIFKRYLVTNIKDYKKENLNIIKCGENTEWFFCTLNALKKIEAKYIMFMLDDYYFSKKMKNEDLLEIVNTMDIEDVFFYRLSIRGDLDKRIKQHQIKTDFVYAINLQPAIWNRKKLIRFLELLHQKGCTSPWDFERYFINRFKKIDSVRIVKGVLYDTRDIMGYKNAIIQGKWVRHVLRYYEKNTDIRLDPGTRPFMSPKKELIDYLKRLSHSVLNYNMRNKIKIFLGKFGFKFMT